MPKFISLTPATSEASEAPKPIVLKPAVEEEVKADDAPVSKMRVLLIDSEACLPFIIRSEIKCSCDTRVEKEISGEYDLLIAHRSDLPEGIDMSKVLLTGEDFPRPLRGRQIRSEIMTYKTTKGF
jgi:hypothetical protein